jgi:hypothetical protein
MTRKSSKTLKDGVGADYRRLVWRDEKCLRRSQGNKLGCWGEAAEADQGNICVSYGCTLGIQLYRYRISGPV